MADRSVWLEVEGPLAILTFHRPPVNALDTTALQELDAALDQVEAETSLRTVVITAAGSSAFAAGADVRMFARMAPEQVREALALGQALFDRLETFPLPVLAAIHGPCLGGGMELAMSCDFRIAARSARFGQPEVRLGLIPGWGGTQRLTRIVGKTRALELLLTGDSLSAEDAWRIGLVTQVVADEELPQRSRELALRLAEGPVGAMAAVKRLVRQASEAGLTAGLAAEQQAFLEVFQTPDAAEGVRAFLERRRPQFSGR